MNPSASERGLITFDIAYIRMSLRVWTFLNAAAGRIVECLPFLRQMQFPGTYLDETYDVPQRLDAEERGGHPHHGELRGRGDGAALLRPDVRPHAHGARVQQAHPPDVAYSSRP